MPANNIHTFEIPDNYIEGFLREELTYMLPMSRYTIIGNQGIIKNACLSYGNLDLEKKLRNRRIVHVHIEETTFDKIIWETLRENEGITIQFQKYASNDVGVFTKSRK